MRQKLKNVLELLENSTQEQLIYHFLAINQRPLRFDALLVGLLNTSTEQMECYAISGRQEMDIQRHDLSIQDLNDPLIQVLRSGEESQWQTLHRGVRIEDARFRNFVYELSSECGLYARPVFDYYGHASGVIAAFSAQPEQCTKSGNIFSLSSELFQHQLKKIQEMELLRQQLRQIREVFKSQQQRQKQLDELLVGLSSGVPKHPPGIAQDYSEINDLTAAVEAFEYDVMVQRLRQYRSDRKRTAMSLNISPRTFTYKLSKYGYEL